MKREKISPRRTAVLVVGFLVCALVFGVMVARRYRQSLMPPPAPTSQSTASTRLVALFFALPSADGLVREGREIDSCTEPAACIFSVLQELQHGPVGDYDGILPDTGPLPKVTVAGDLVVLDVPAELVAELPGGSAAELATVYGLVNTITVNFPAIKRVQFLLDGKKAETLTGHIDISAPLTQDLSYEQKSDKASSGTAPGDSGVKR